MRTNRTCFLHPVAVMMTLVLGAVGCVQPADNATSATIRDEYGVVAQPPLPLAAPGVEFDPLRSIANADATVVVDLEARILRFRDGSSNATIAQRDVGETNELRAVAGDGLRAALFEHVDEPVLGGTSLITTVDLHTGSPEPVMRLYEVPGLVEPEAFSTDGTLLYVIDHQVGDQVGSYRVRPLDLETGTLQAIVGPSKVPFDENMNGSGRRQQWAPGANRLYTLYIRQTHHHHDGESSRGASHEHTGSGTDGFVHVLDLKEEWAFCLDLPPAFGGGDLATTALGVSPDGKTVAVADVNAGQIAFASTSTLAVTRVADLPSFAPSGELHLGLTNDDLVLGWGTEIMWLDRETLAVTRASEETLPAPLMGFTSSGGSVLAWPSSGDPQTLLAPS